MSPTEFIPIACSLVSCGCALWVTIRAGNWRGTDEAKALLKRLSDVEQLTTLLGARQQGVPTQADLERLRGEVHVVVEVVRGAAAGVDRIETFWMEERRGQR